MKPSFTDVSVNLNNLDVNQLFNSTYFFVGIFAVAALIATGLFMFAVKSRKLNLAQILSAPFIGSTEDEPAEEVEALTSHVLRLLSIIGVFITIITGAFAITGYFVATSQKVTSITQTMSDKGLTISKDQAKTLLNSGNASDKDKASTADKLTIPTVRNGSKMDVEYVYLKTKTDDVNILRPVDSK